MKNNQDGCFGCLNGRYEHMVHADRQTGRLKWGIFLEKRNWEVPEKIDRWGSEARMTDSW